MINSRTKQNTLFSIIEMRARGGKIENNVCKRTVFPKLELRRRNVILQTTLTERIISTRRESVVDFFVYAMKNTVICIRYFSNTKHKSAKKKYRTMFFNRIAVHMQNF